MLIVLRSYLVLNVLDIIRYLVDFITDNEVEVISRYLSNANIFISTGYAMRLCRAEFQKKIGRSWIKAH